MAGGNQGGDKAREDAWDRLARRREAELRGEDPDLQEIGETHRLVSGRTQRMQVLSTDPSVEILQLLNETLAASSDRVDVWMMRFEAQKSLGFKQEFADALAQAWKNPVVSRQLDWTMLSAMWQDMAPGEPVPVELKKMERPTVELPVAPTAKPTAAGTIRNRRFADFATQIAAPELAALARAYAQLRAKPRFVEEFALRIAPQLRRPTPLELSEPLSQAAGPHARVFLKREDQRGVAAELDHAVAQCYIAALLGATSVITANDVDAHAIAAATVAPRFKLGCTVIVQPDDESKRAPLLAKLRQLGAKVEPMPTQGMTSADPREGAVRRWQSSGGDAHLLLSLGTAPAPYPTMATQFQALLGREADVQYNMLDDIADRARTLVAAVSSESDSIGFVLPFLGRKEVELVFAEPEPGGVASWRPNERLRQYNGQIREHAWLHSTGRIEHVALADSAARDSRTLLARCEPRIDVSLEDARAVALASLLTQRDKERRDFVVLVA